MIEESKANKATLSTLRKETEAFKSTETTAILYQKMHEEDQNIKEELSQTLKVKEEKIASLEAKAKKHQ